MRRFYPELTVLTTWPTARPKVAVNCQDSNLATLEPHVSYEALLHHCHDLRTAFLPGHLLPVLAATAAAVEPTAAFTAVLTAAAENSSDTWLVI